LSKTPKLIKIGSAVLTDEQGRLDIRVISHLVKDIAAMVKDGQPVCLVSSGAIGAGLSVLQPAKQPRKIRKMQALAAVGQVRLMEVYQKEFAKHGLPIGQILLSHEDFAHRKSFLNTRATLEQLLNLGVIPIINENDTVSTEEIQFGDNDRLAVLLANVIESQEVLILSTIDGLKNTQGDQAIIPVVKSINADILSLAQGGNNLGRGGMGSKLMSIDLLNRSGKTVWLANGKSKKILSRWHQGENIGTRFETSHPMVSSREQWMIQHLAPKGTLFIDHGAKEALLKRRASLLPVGILKVEGNFDPGQLISIVHGKEEIARGMSRMDHLQTKSVLGKSKDEIQDLLPPTLPLFVVHRNDLVFLDPN
jgi:glutamate 5-kinase